MSCILIVLNLLNLAFNVLVVLALLADTTQLGKLFNVFINVLVKPNFRIDRILHAVACMTVTINQSLFATKFASWLFHCQISQIWRFSK